MTEHALSQIHSEIVSGLGLITLNRPEALNALSLGMVRELYSLLVDWKDNPDIEAVAIRGCDKEGPFGAFCAGGDIRFFYHSAITNDPALEDFFTQEYRLNHLIFNYPKPYIAFMDGVVMGGGMGISQGASLRIVTERSKLAMPETNIGLFPDVGGSYFLSRCPGASGEYLALTGQRLLGADALTLGLADGLVSSDKLEFLWDQLISDPNTSIENRLSNLSNHLDACKGQKPAWLNHPIDRCFNKTTVSDIISALEAHNTNWSKSTITVLRKRSPLMLQVALKQIHLGRNSSLADNLRMERDLIQHCFYTRHLGRSGTTSETVEGIRALVIDKDHRPIWKPSRIEDVTEAMVAAFFISPWPIERHPLADLR